MISPYFVDKAHKNLMFVLIIHKKLEENILGSVDECI